MDSSGSTVLIKRKSGYLRRTQGPIGPLIGILNRPFGQAANADYPCVPSPSHILLRTPLWEIYESSRTPAIVRDSLSDENALSGIGVISAPDK